MTLTPMTLGRAVRKAAQSAQPAAVHEGRIATVPNAAGMVYVTIRSLTGDNMRHGPFAAGHLHDHAGATVIRPVRNDRCWIALDQGGDPAAIVSWEPRA